MACLPWPCPFRGGPAILWLPRNSEQALSLSALRTELNHTSSAPGRCARAWFEPRQNRALEAKAEAPAPLHPVYPCGGKSPRVPGARWRSWVPQPARREIPFPPHPGALRDILAVQAGYESPRRSTLLSGRRPRSAASAALPAPCAAKSYLVRV